MPWKKGTFYSLSVTLWEGSSHNFGHHALDWGLVSSAISSCPCCCSRHISAYIPPRDNRDSCLEQGGKCKSQLSGLLQESLPPAHRDNGFGERESSSRNPWDFTTISWAHNSETWPCSSCHAPYRPLSTMQPSLMTRIWSALTTVESLRSQRPVTHCTPRSGPAARCPGPVPVCHYNGGAVGAHFGQRRLDGPLIRCIQCRCCLQRGSE